MEDELIQEFVTEAREHLATIEADLLSIEKAGANADDQLLNKVFRAAHSIKGAAGFFDLGNVKELAHKAETVLDMLRSRKMQSNAEITNVLLRAFDKLRELVDSPESSNAADINDEVDGLDALARSYLPPQQKSMVAAVIPTSPAANHGLTSVTQFEFQRLMQEHGRIYCIHLDLLHDIDRKGQQILRLFRDLQEHGEVVDCRLDFEKVGTLDGPISNHVPLDVIFATGLTQSETSSLFHVPEDRVQPLQTELAPVDTEALRANVEAEAELRKEQQHKEQQYREHQSPEVTFAERTERSCSQLAPLAREATAVAAPVPGNTAGDETLRVNVGLLDALMNLAGELVLSRNQFQAAISQHNQRMLTSAGQRLSQVTSEIQDAIMRTRLQPIENVFSRLPRVVRDLAKTLGKEVNLEVGGKEVALDRSLVEGLSDPLTHMVRNAIDHGIEFPEVRVQSGKPRAGTLRVDARHEAGQVIIEIADDGKGIDQDKVANAAVAKGLITREQLKGMGTEEVSALILLPGLSTAEKLTQVSGRGVGMDVVKSNLDRLGGQIEITSQHGQGTLFRIKLPLTLTIIPALIVSVGQERFAIPQANVEELLRIRGGDEKRRIEVIGGSNVLVLREGILPLLRLDEFLGVTQICVDIEGKSRPGILEIAVVYTGTFRYGLVVEHFHNTEEIVVKPLGRDLKESREYAGATVLGDGAVALILDAAGLAARAELFSTSSSSGSMNHAQQSAEQLDSEDSSHALLSFRNGPDEHCAVPLEIVRRIERVKGTQLETIGGRRTMQYRGRSLPILALSDAASVAPINHASDLAVIVTTLYDREVGLLVAMPVDVIEAEMALDSTTHRQPGISGSTIIRGKTTLLVDLIELIETVYPEWRNNVSAQKQAGGPEPLVLLAEDSDFFRAQVKRFLEADGHQVIDAVDGEDAWELLLKNVGKVRVLVTDIEMPRLNGLQLTTRIRSDERTRYLPVIAVSSLAGEEDVARAKAAGVDEYEIKLDRDNLLSRVRTVLAGTHFTQAACSAD